jgi:predicted lipoprotein with Yx(FWY)xxD motif
METAEPPATLERGDRAVTPDALEGLAGMRIQLFSLVLALAGAALLVAVPAGPAATGSAMVTVRGSDYGRILFDGTNRALYAFARDPRGKTTCYGACAVAWPPYIVRGTLRAGTGTKRTLLGTTKRRDGTRQLTYAGRPLYYYVHDPRGQVLCHNVREYGGLWLVVRGTGTLVR